MFIVILLLVLQDSIDYRHVANIEAGSWNDVEKRTKLL